MRFMSRFYFEKIMLAGCSALKDELAADASG
jgi:hypothetical protein